MKTPDDWFNNDKVKPSDLINNEFYFGSILCEIFQLLQPIYV